VRQYIDKSTKDKRKVLQFIDFTDLESDIKKVSQKYFKHWSSLRKQDATCNDEELMEDFKIGFIESVDIFWDPENRNPDSCTSDDLRLIKEVTGGYLNKTWNNRYLKTVTEEQTYDVIYHINSGRDCQFVSW
jgi:hypothetical protein